MVRPVRSQGFNVVGYLSGNLGLGVVARQLARLILERGLPLATFDIDAGGARGGHDLSFRDYAVPTPFALPYAITLFVLPPMTIAALSQDPALRPLLLQRDGIQAAFLMWEHPRIPRLWRPALRTLDVIVAASHFIRSACETCLDEVLTIPAVCPLHLPQVTPNRERFRLPSDAVVFVTSFEAYGADRKNPLASLAAFRRAASIDQRAMLVIKVNNPMDGRVPHAIVRRLRAECGSDPRLRLIEEPLSYPDVLSLYASCDIFVSLHRSEGLGLGLLEAMALGKPVIGTAWSGNMTFMNAVNSCPVSYRLIPVRSTLDVYSKRLLGRDALWAEPDVDDAAAWMMRLLAEPSVRFRIGLRAAEFAKTWEREALRAGFLDDLLSIHEYLPLMASYKARKARLPEIERGLTRQDTRRTLRGSVERALDRHIRWRLKH